MVRGAGSFSRVPFEKGPAMQWPKDILDRFDHSLEIEPVEGVDKLTVLRTMLDETVRRAIGRAGGNPALASAALRTPMTPLGSVTTECINGLARRLSFTGMQWSGAVKAFHSYVENNAEVVFAAFANQGVDYDHDVGFGPLVSREGEEPG